MKIIDNKKDYYDWLVSKWGEDELIVYDRRGSAPSAKIVEENKPFFDAAFNPDIDWPSESGWIPNGSTSQFIIPLDIVLEVGATHYYIDVKRTISADKSVVISWEIQTQEQWEEQKRKSARWGWLKKMTEKEIADSRKKFSDSPLAIKFVYPNGRTYRARKSETIYNNPILKDIPRITGLIGAEELWHGVSDYISSLNNKQIEDTRTDVQHLENAGFDKKTSFRKV